MLSQLAKSSTKANILFSFRRSFTITTSNKQQDNPEANSRFPTSEAYKGGLSQELPPKADDWQNPKKQEVPHQRVPNPEEQGDDRKERGIYDEPTSQPRSPHPPPGLGNEKQTPGDMGPTQIPGLDGKLSHGALHDAYRDVQGNQSGETPRGGLNTFMYQQHDLQHERRLAGDAEGEFDIYGGKVNMTQQERDQWEFEARKQKGNQKPHGQIDSKDQSPIVDFQKSR
ncbi:hypothetical protein FGO68_gene878 [Halteria grandinella]|uniref:Uncharacterized protein n=1 Tax=Halteria grandinella TaxID=5974 RepID=A0A8J8SX72_HALGN|nr:hypothetical protein FGO68_gene878 [Halteria grandinella]